MSDNEITRNELAKMKGLKYQNLVFHLKRPDAPKGIKKWRQWFYDKLEAEQWEIGPQRRGRKPVSHSNGNAPVGSPTTEVGR